MNVQMKELELLEKIQGKYSDQEVDQIIRKKYKKWQKRATEKMSHYDKQERIFLAYKEAVQQFSDVKLPVEPALLEVIVSEDIEKTNKYVQAIIQFAFKIDPFRN